MVVSSLSLPSTETVKRKAGVKELDCAQIIRECLEVYKVYGISFQSSNLLDSSWVNSNDEGIVVTFTYLSDTEALLTSLIDIGLGSTFGTLSIIPVEVTRPQIDEFNSRHADKNSEILGAPRVSEKIQAATADFVSSIQTKLMFDRIIEQTREQSVLSFDFIVLLTVASSISAVGLAVNSVVAIVASMLISPLMGPILAWYIYPSHTQVFWNSYS